MRKYKNEQNTVLKVLKIFKQLFAGLTVISFSPTFIFVQDVNVSSTFFKGLVGLQVNLTHPDKAKYLKNKFERDEKKLSEVTWICRQGR